MEEKNSVIKSKTLVTSIVLTDEHDIQIYKEKFEYQGKKMSIRNIPFVRYRFDKYGENSVEYIRKMMETFSFSAHMAEIVIDENAKEVADRLADNFDNLIIFFYVKIGDQEVLSGLNDEVKELVAGIKKCTYDRIVVKDESTSLHLVSANRIRNQISELTGFKSTDIGLCQSPLSFDGDACLTAVRARELSAMYSENDEVALPSSNHECMSTCGCIRYLIIDSPVTVKGNEKVMKCEKKNEKTSTTKKKISSRVISRVKL